MVGLLVHIYQKEKIALRNGSEIARMVHIINVQLSMHICMLSVMKIVFVGSWNLIRNLCSVVLTKIHPFCETFKKM